MNLCAMVAFDLNAIFIKLRTLIFLTFKKHQHGKHFCHLVRRVNPPQKNLSRVDFARFLCVDHGSSTFFRFFCPNFSEKNCKYHSGHFMTSLPKVCAFPGDSTNGFAVKIHEFATYLVFFSRKFCQNSNRHTIVFSIPFLPKY